MAFPTVATKSNAYQRPSAFRALYVRPPSGGKYQTVGDIADAELQFIPVESNNSSGKNRQCSYTFKASCKMMQASVTEIELIDSIVDGTNNFLFKMSDAAAIPTGGSAVTEGWVLLTSAQVGVKATPMLSGDSDSYRYITLEFQGSLVTEVAYQAAVKAAIDDDEFESSADSGTFHAIGTYTAAKDGGSPKPANKKPNGISSCTLAETGGAAQTIGDIKNFNCVFTALTSQETLQRFQQFGYKIELDYEWKQTDAANLLNLWTMTDTEIDAVITFADGLVMTLTNKVGISTGYTTPSDPETIKFVPFKHTGTILNSDLDGIFA